MQYYIFINKAVLVTKYLYPGFLKLHINMILFFLSFKTKKNNPYENEKTDFTINSDYFNNTVSLC